MHFKARETCLLILVIIKASSSLNEKQCNNVNCSCAQGLGVCKPECKTEEERLGSCQGANCSCCKITEKGGEVQSELLTNLIIKGKTTDTGEMYERGRGCEFESNVYADGALWTLDCMEHRCIGGQLFSKKSPNCCEFEGKRYCDGDTWSRFCTVYKCNQGHVNSEEDDKCCEDDGKKYLSGDSWTEGCFEIVCHMGVVEEKQLPSCCRVDEVLYESNQTWTNACDHFKCNNGMVERSDIQTCCPGPGGVMKPSGASWMEGCNKNTCINGTIQIDTSACTTPAPVKEEIIIPATDPPAFDEGVPVIAKCRYNNSWMEDGTSLIEGCFVITCQGGCTCYKKLEGGCCYNDETEYLYEGQTQEKNCKVYSCTNGNVEQKESTSSECLPKVEGCMYGEKEYAEGETINYGCSIHQCTSGKFISYPDPTCCVVDGSAYPSGSKWEEECYTVICDMGLIKKTAKIRSCNDCPRVQGCQEVAFYQMPQIQTCQSCCTVGTAVYQNGQTWMNNCYSNTCNQGIISTTVIPNCG